MPPGTKHIRTTAYHPCAHGHVECLHRVLKGHPNQEHWTDALPLFLLGIRTALNGDICSTSDEQVYGTTLRLPGAYFSHDDSPDPTSYVETLRRRMQLLKATPVSHADDDTTGTLREAKHDYIRRDAVRKPLQTPYDGPYKVLNRATKHITVDLNGYHDTVAIDRLKPTILENIPDSVSHSSTHFSSPPPTPLPMEPPTTKEASPTMRTTR